MSRAKRILMNCENFVVCRVAMMQHTFIQISRIEHNNTLPELVSSTKERAPKWCSGKACPNLEKMVKELQNIFVNCNYFGLVYLFFYTASYNRKNLVRQ